MFSRIERQRIEACAIAQLRAEVESRPQAWIESAFDDIATRPFFVETVDILCDALTHERCSRLNEATR